MRKVRGRDETKAPVLFLKSIREDPIKEDKEMTIRELRQLLTDVDNQGMTVRELRALLFAEDDQEQEANFRNIVRITNK